jgi:hypothetical protein
MMETLFRELAGLFERMDEAYGRAGGAHGFVCCGCEENCCRTRFHHYTLCEYLYLRKGFSRLVESDRQRIAVKASRVMEAAAEADDQGRPAVAMCPLNENERCVLYAYRPMICRLHGIPHRLTLPDGRQQVGPGCADFDRQCGPADNVFLDRTPLYAGLADLEQRARRQSAFKGKLRMTIAQILTQEITLPNPIGFGSGS